MYTQNQLDEIANKLDTRPRKTLGFKTPAEMFEEALHCPLERADTIFGVDYLPLDPLKSIIRNRPQSTAMVFSKICFIIIQIRNQPWAG